MPEAGPALPGDKLVQERWRKLQRVLAQRYANPAEAFVAFGGRMGYELRSGEFERALRDVGARERTISGSGAVDVHGLMSDFENHFPRGMLWEQFVAALKWEDGDSAPSVAKPKKSVVIPSFPSSTFRAAQSTQPAALRASGALMQGGAVSALRQSRDQGAARASQQPPKPAQYVGVDDGTRLGASWTRGQGPPPNWMVRQRQVAASNATPLAGGRQLAPRAPRAKVLEKKLKYLEQEDQKLHTLLQDRAETRDADAAPRQAPAARPSAPRQDPAARPSAAAGDDRSPRYASPRHASPRTKGGKKDKEPVMSEEAQGVQHRLGALNDLVLEQRISLAETEKNILVRERHELEVPPHQALPCPGGPTFLKLTFWIRGARP